MKKRLKRRNMQPEQKTDRNPVLLRVKFLTIAAQRQIHALHHQPRSRSLARERASGGLWGAFEQGIWCGRAEVVLDDNTQFLHDNWNDIPEAERDSLESKTADLLDAYAENCGSLA